jgi:hypothetical protein
MKPGRPEGIQQEPEKPTFIITFRQPISGPDGLKHAEKKGLWKGLR